MSSPKFVLLGLSLFVFLSKQAQALNCYNGVSIAAVSSSCSESLCQNITTTTGGSTSTTYSCGTSGSVVGCTETNGVKTCICNTELCNKASGGGIKCYVGAGTLKMEKECDAGVTQCTKTGLGDLAAYDCGTSGEAETCAKVLTLSKCTCGGNLCNSASELGLSTFLALVLSMLVAKSF